MRFEHIPFESKESDFIVYKCVQDSMGYIWFGTVEGLYKYNGYECRRLEYQTPNGMTTADRTTRAVFIDREGDLWYGSDAGVLGHLTFRDGVLQRFTERSRDVPPFPGGSITSLCEDQERNLWIGTDRHGVFKFERRSKRFTRFEHDSTNPNTLSNNGVQAVSIDAYKNIWVGTDSGLTIFNPHSGQFSRFFHEGNNLMRLDNSSVLEIYHDPFGTMWVCTKTGVNKAIPTHNGSWQFYSYEIPGNFVRSVLLSDRNILWAGTKDGLAKLDLSTRSVEVFTHDKNISTSLSNEEIRNIMRDRSGILWVGTNNGINKLNRGVEQFRNYTFNSDLSESPEVYTLCEAKDGTLWFGNYEGLFHANSQSGRIEKYLHNPNDSHSLNTDLVMRLLPDRFSPPNRNHGILWIGTWEGGINKLDLKTKQFTSYRWAFSGRDNNVVYSLYQDEDGILWIGTLHEGLQSFDPETGKFRTAGMVNLRVMAIAETHDHKLWVATAREGLFRYDKYSYSTVNFRTSALDTATIDDNSVSAFYEDARHRLWVGTEKGLNLFNAGSNSFIRYGTSKGIPEIRIQSIAGDTVGRLWMATVGHGLVSLDPSSDTAVTFSKADGLLSDNFFDLHRLNTKEMIGCTEAGLIVFQPEALRKASYVPPVYLSSLKIFETRLAPDLNTSLLKEIVLPYDSNFFTFEFAALDYNDPGSNVFQYKLEGVDRDWVNAGVKHIAPYTKVDNGSYVFKVRGAGSDGAWSTHEASSVITILPPYWKTWWFRLLVGLLLAAIATAAYRYRVNRLLEMERMRLRIASDLHDDIGSSLGTIALMTDLIRDKDGLQQETKEDLAQIGMNARSSAEALRDIVWVINPESDKLDNMILRMKDAAMQMLPNHGLTFHINCNKLDQNSSIAFRRNLMLIYKEILHNIVKHAHATTVSITMEEQDGTLTLKIQDDGKGFVEPELEHVNGLKNMRRRAEEMKGTIDIASNPNDGTTAKLNVRIT